MRWNFIRRTWVKPSEKSDSSRKKPKSKRTPLWTFLCSQRKPTSLQSSREEICASYRRPRTNLKLRYKRTASIESFSDLVVKFPRKSGVFDSSVARPTVTASIDNSKANNFGFCPTCHNIVLPVSEQLLKHRILSENGYDDIGQDESNLECLNEVQYWPYDANAGCDTMYESVYESTSPPFAQINEWDRAPNLNTLIGRTNNDCTQNNMDSSLIYDMCVYQESGSPHHSTKQFPSLPWVSSTLKRSKQMFTDCETIYDEVASDVEDQESCKLDHLPMGIEEDDRPHRKRCASQLDYSRNEMKRIRREIFVYEE